MGLIEKYSADGQGYHPFLIRPQWQVALLNYAPEESLEAIEKIDIHYQTDEAFVILEGRAALIAATIGDGEVSFEAVDMQPNIVYNIPKDVWHKIAMYPGSKVLIIENKDTHLGDFEFYNLSSEQKNDLCTVVEMAMNRSKEIDL